VEFSVANVNVYGIDETILASSYPKSVDTVQRDLTEQDWKRARVLGKVPSGSGHDCMMKGIIMQCDITASHAFWLQYGRYHFSDIISSQSKMHRIMEMDLSYQCNHYVDQEVINRCNELKNEFLSANTRENFHHLIHNLPMGLMLTARITDNYLSLKTQYYQRRHEKLDEWLKYCAFMLGLPHFKELLNV